MRSFASKLSLALLSSVVAVSVSFGAGTGAASGEGTVLQIDMKDYQGQTCYNLLLAAGGLKDDLNTDQTTEFTVLPKVDATDPKSLNAAAVAIVDLFQSDFDPKDYKSMISMFKDGEKGLIQFFSDLAGMRLTPAIIRAKLADKLKAEGDLSSPNKIGLDAAISEPIVLALSGRGVLIKVNDNIDIMAEAYKPDDVKTGRTYVRVKGVQKWLDPSDTFLLKETGDTLKGLPVADFEHIYGALFDLVMKSDATALGKLSMKAQALVANIYAVITAEARRSAESNFQQHLWMNDLLEAFIDSIIPVQTDKTWDFSKAQGGIVAGDPTSFFGVGTQGSGIGGKKGMERKNFQKLITQALVQLDPQVVQEAKKYIGDTTDIIDGFAKFIGNPANVKKGSLPDADGLGKAYQDVVRSIHDNAGKIVSFIQGKAGGGTSPASGQGGSSSKIKKSSGQGAKKPSGLIFSR